MKISFFTTSFPYKWPLINENSQANIRWGGVEEVTYQLAMQLNKKGHEILIFTTSASKRQEIHKHENITVFRYASIFKIGSTSVSPSFLLKPLNYDVDIVHIQRGSPPATFSGYLYSKIKKKKYILSNHGDLLLGEKYTHRILMTLFRKMMNKVLKDATVVTVLSKEIASTFSFLDQHTEKIQIIPNGVDIDKYKLTKSKQEHKLSMGYPHDSKIILFVGSLVKNKAPHVLVKSMVHVIKEVPNSHLILVGDGICKKKLETLSQELEIENHIEYVGFVSDEAKLADIYNTADIFVLPSFSEGFPMVLLEASAAGLPMVVSDLECFKVLIQDNYNGVFTRKRDELDLAEKIIFLLKDDNIQKNISRNAKNKVIDFTWEKVAEQTEKVYNSLLLME